MNSQKPSKNFFNNSSELSPNEAKVFRVLRILAGKQTEIVCVPLRRLARKARLCYEFTRRAVHLLSLREVILYSPGKNQCITSCFIHRVFPRKKSRVPVSTRVIPKKAKMISRKAKFPSKSSNVNVYKYLINNVNVGKTTRRPKEDSSLNNSRDSRAVEIAVAFKDEVNLGLYLSYCRKYPPEIIDKAFKVASETPPERIKRSRGAFFTYLVKTYAQNQKHPDFGS